LFAAYRVTSPDSTPHRHNVMRNVSCPEPLRRPHSPSVTSPRVTHTEPISSQPAAHLGKCHHTVISVSPFHQLGECHRGVTLVSFIKLWCKCHHIMFVYVII